METRLKITFTIVTQINMAEAQEKETESPKLSEIFDDVFDICDKVENSSEATNSANVTRQILKGISLSEKAIMMVNGLHVFSDNEELEEMATADMKYILLPAFLAYLTTTKTCKPEDRMQAVTKALAYNKDFLRLCKLYGLTDIELETDSSDAHHQEAPRVPPLHGQQGIITMANTRAQKIEQLKKKQENTKQLLQLRQYMQQEHVEDEVKRKYYKTLIEKWIYFSKEELDNLKSEVTMLEFMEKRKAAQGSNPTPTKTDDKPKPVFRPIILTRSAMEKAVFGAGYPSLPTYTVEEWYEQQAASGAFSKAQSSLETAVDDGDTEAARKERDDEAKEKKIENDDEETLMKARQWDDWKDDHRRGEGNTHNKG